MALVGDLRARVTADVYERAVVKCAADDAGGARGGAGPEVATNARKRSRENETAEDGAVASAAAADAPARKRTKTPSESNGTGQKKKKTKGKKKKKRREFDHARFRRRHVALRVAYLGAEYHGFARQQDMQNNPINTVEHHLFKAMIKVCLIKCGLVRLL